MKGRICDSCGSENAPWASFCCSCGAPQSVAGPPARSEDRLAPRRTGWWGSLAWWQKTLVGVGILLAILFVLVVVAMVIQCTCFPGATTTTAAAGVVSGWVL